MTEMEIKYSMINDPQCWKTQGFNEFRERHAHFEFYILRDGEMQEAGKISHAAIRTIAKLQKRRPRLRHYSRKLLWYGDEIRRAALELRR